MAASSLVRAALTGGIATGKSWCLREFARLGAPTIDADEVSRALVAPGEPALEEIVARFGGIVRRRDGGLDRVALGRIVFADATARADLERILHPRVYARMRDWFAALATATPAAAAAIADVPLLYETGRERDFDRVIVAWCPPEQQRARLIARDGLSGEEADQRLAAQWPIDEKAARADTVIDTSGSFEETTRQVDEIWRRLATAGRTKRGR